VRKFLGLTGLLALLVIPMTASAGETTKPGDLVKVCATVKVAANVNAGANIGLTGSVLKKGGINQNLTAGVAGDVYVVICVFVERATLDPKGDLGASLPSGKCGDGKTGIELSAVANLRTALLAGGNVRVEIGVIVGSSLTEKQIVVDETLNLAANVALVDEVLADLTVCVDAGVEVDLGGDKK